MGERQWIGLTALAIGIAAATVAVPPLIAPKHKAEPGPSGSPSPPVPPPARGSAGAPSFAPIHIQAEDPGNELTGGASPIACGTCRGGKRVRYLCAECRLVVRATLPVAGPREITVFYETDGHRRLKVSVNGGPARIFDVDGPGWTVPQSFRFTAELPAGELRLTLYNDESPAPDLDEVMIA
ncbi:hypothetical protein AB0M46_01595 [Dactylosporangium sp. NPDC051485]|uniref:hypothetical protein n=1 Tax=Dactylosporangium sp. NPDC051485 TaxID=3154846 RepID=UPI00342DE4F1